MKHARRSTRLKGHDYTSAGAYFVTVVAHARECLFGEVVEGEMHLNDLGRAVDDCWRAIPEHFANVELDVHLVMPNHVHGILWIIDETAKGEVLSPAESADPSTKNRLDAANHRTARAPSGVGATHASPLHKRPFLRLADSSQPRGPKRGSLAAILGSFKSAASRRLHAEHDLGRVWHRNYHDHIIRDDQDLERIRNYILNNPVNWNTDEENRSSGRYPAG